MTFCLQFQLAPLQLGRLDTTFAAELSTELAKNMKNHMMSPPRQYVR